MNFSVLESHFNEAQIFVDADVTYVTHDPFSKNFLLYDVYNKGRQLGGELNITADREIFCNKTNCRVERYLSELYTRSALQHRKSFTGLTMRATAVVCEGLKILHAIDLFFKQVTALPLNVSIKEIFDFMNSKYRIQLDTYARLGYQARQPLRDMLDCKWVCLNEN